ncbi:MAG: helix-turn-helix transcriptional regulator [Syntrophales bacterium]
MKIERVIKGLTQYDLAAATGIPQSKLSLLENGYATPSEKERKAIAAVLDMNVDELTFPKDHKDSCGDSSKGTVEKACKRESCGEQV